MKKLSLALLLAGAIFLAGCQGPFMSTNAVSTQTIPGGIVLFYGDTCPHCAVVRKYLTDNNVSAKVQYTESEVYENQNNANLMSQIALQKCGFKTGDQVGVPFLWDGPDSKCIVGDVDAIAFFKDKAGIK